MALATKLRIDADLELDERPLPMPKPRLRLVPKPGALQPAPFLKWVGGKGKLLRALRPLLPQGRFRYAEPFVGGGAMFFDLHAQNQTHHALLCDAGRDLVGAYKVVRDALPELLEALQLHEDRYLQGTEEKRALYFYAVRNRHPSEHAMSDVERAARMLFLNRTCFNGLWRENRAGKFNAPHGRYANPGIVQAEKLQAASQALQLADIRHADFRALPELVQDQAIEFVYLDPPYHPLNVTSSFNAYSGGQFSAKAQSDLADVCTRLDRMGVRFLLSNSDCPLIRDLYRGFNIGTIRAARSINCQGSGRGEISEVVVRNYG